MAIMARVMRQVRRDVQPIVSIYIKSLNLKVLQVSAGFRLEGPAMYQLVYISSATPGEAISVGDILIASRRNNTRDGITGLLYSNGKRFLQALEGPEDKVLAAMARIQGDKRHRAVVVLSRRAIEAREFGDWAMAHGGGDADDAAMIARIEKLVENAAPDVRATFESFCKLRRAA